MRRTLDDDELERLLYDLVVLRLIRMGGSDPDAKAPPRRRPNPDGSWSFDED